MTQKCHHFVATLEILKCKKHISVFAVQIFVETVFIVSVVVTSESSCSLYKRDQFMSAINTDE